MNQTANPFEDDLDAENTDEATDPVEATPADDAPSGEIFDAFTAAVSNDKTGDDVKLAMIQAGAKFSNVTRLFNQYSEHEGLLTSKEDREAVIEKVCTDVDLEDEASFGECVTEVEDGIDEIDDKKAAVLIRGWAKKNDIKVFKKPRGAGRQGFSFQLYDWYRKNPSSTYKELEAYLTVANGASENDVRHLSHYARIQKLCNDIASDYAEAAAA